MKCKDCAFFDHAYGDNGGICKRYPPTIQTRRDGKRICEWPAVYFNQWCGEFELRAEFPKFEACKHGNFGLCYECCGESEK